jgi:hypothetical protein
MLVSCAPPRAPTHDGRCSPGHYGVSPDVPTGMLCSAGEPHQLAEISQMSLASI